MNRQHIKCIISTHSLTRRLTTFPDGTKKTIDISTHSLTRRLTIGSCTDHLVAIYFNSQPHKEADCDRLSRLHQDFIFQLTASQGG